MPPHIRLSHDISVLITKVPDRNLMLFRNFHVRAQMDYCISNLYNESFSKSSDIVKVFHFRPVWRVMLDHTIPCSTFVSPYGFTV
jgi:hypothetical protein